MSHNMKAHERGEVSSCEGCEREEYERIQRRRDEERAAYEAENAPQEEREVE